MSSLSLVATIMAGPPPYWIAACLTVILLVEVLIILKLRHLIVQYQNAAEMTKPLCLVSTLILAYLVSVFFWHPYESEEYDASVDKFRIADTTFVLGLSGTAKRTRWPLGHDRLSIGSPYHVTLYANVNRADYALTINALSIASTTITNLSLVPSHGSVQIALHTGYDYEFSPSFSNSYWSYSLPRVDIPLDYSLDTRAIVTIDASLQNSSGYSRMTNSIVFVQSDNDHLRSSWRCY